MFKKLIDKVKSRVADRIAFDPAKFADPVAMATEWTPAKSGGSNFRTHKLVTVHSDRLQFKAVAGALFFYALFMLIGLGVFIAFLSSGLSSGELAFDLATILPLTLGLFFTIIGGVMFLYGTTPIVFDKTKGFFWKGRKAPYQVSNLNSLKYCTELKEIHALQLLSEYCRSDKSSFYSYELNLVLASGARINVVDHGNKDSLRKEASMLASFLDKPVWDAT